MTDTSDRRARLSADRRALLERLRGAGAGSGTGSPASAPVRAPAAEHTGEQAARARHDLGVEDHHAPESACTERRERAVARLDGADHVRVHAAHRVTTRGEVGRVEVVIGLASRK